MRGSNLDVAEAQGAKVLPPDANGRLAKMARAQLGAIFEELDRRGNTQEEFFKLAEASQASIERALFSAYGQVPARVQSTIGRNVMLATVLLRVLRGTPMYGSRALSVQLEEQLEQVIGIAREVVEAPSAIEPQPMPESFAAPEPDASEAEKSAFAEKIHAWTERIDDMMGAEHPDLVLSVAVSWLLNVISKLECKHGVNMDFGNLAEEMQARLSVARAQYPVKGGPLAS